MHNTAFGALVGSLPPLLGTMAALGTFATPETFLLASYIFSWQYPHFFGILYENKEDYRKAEFEMLSNYDEDGSRAHKYILACGIVNTILPLAMIQQGMIMWPLLLPFYGLQFQTFKCISAFKREQGSQEAAKNLKKSQYLPFFLLLSSIYITTAYKSYQNRKRQ